ncbi:MAG: ribonuclease P protein component [Aphanocapsa feldmannii 277cV]|uniref:Ribonuclease P protein component n=2 Tax=Aphanocapsa feldmannii TaxID=192050 RepID=A0A524RQ94_9CHRO|nr:MAG: ribonuclease P protein component [Aphanocapsa feldmannii 288cV]TGG94607.1 MAG: ribonuclease P protein component [Aphanocapsa feldmannii 277cV]TGH23616.1 MAG: ribonuclease P protein component [Aphanocapsa feldmannii 277cI]
MVLPRRHRLSGRSVFQHLYRRGKQHHGEAMVLRVARPEPGRLRPGLLPHIPAQGRLDGPSLERLRRQATATELRLAVVISNKVSKRAVLRNRLRRLLHDSFRREVAGLKPGSWLLLSLRPGAAERGSEPLLREWLDLLTRADLRR